MTHRTLARSPTAPPTTARSNTSAGSSIALPTFAELAEPASIAAQRRERLAGVDPDAADALNLFRVHWYNDAARTGLADVPAHVVLPEALTGVRSPIIVALGDRFPMIRAHKVLPAYACLVSRLVTGRFDPARQRALWPSTGNYCRGGVAISRIVGCHGVAILPAGMSDERFHWLERWVTDAGRHRAHAGHREQRARDLRRLRRARRRTRPTSCSTSSASSPTTSPTTPSPGARFGARVRVGAGAGTLAAPGRLRRRQRFGRHAGRGRLAEGAPRREDRRRRGARMPDDALQRLRRAQHPGHRRQAHPVHPQRDEHRRRRRGVRSRHRPALRALQRSPKATRCCAAAASART